MGPSVENLIGRSFGDYTVIAKLGKIVPRTGLHSNGILWTCRCKCGRIFYKRRFELLHKNVRCGSHRSQYAGESRQAYQAYHDAKRRCENPDSSEFHNYGARGIRFLWTKYDDFWKELGPTWVEGLELDRIDTNSNYGPNLCRWATHKEQCRNKRATARYSVNGKIVAVAELAETHGIPYDTLRWRLLIAKWPYKKAVTAPVRVLRPYRRHIR